MPSETSLLPNNSTPLERGIEHAISKGFDFPVLIGTLWNADTCPVEALPFLAHAMSANFFDPAWPEDLQRAMLRNTPELHLWLGTLPGMHLALKYAGYGDAVIIQGKDAFVGSDWVVGDPNQPVGGPQRWNEFWVIIQQEITQDQLNYLVGIAKTAKPLFTDLTRVTVEHVNQVVGAPWNVGDETVNVGSTYKIGDLNA